MIEEKLEYLIETKKQIKNAIVEKGQPVADTDTFRSYADKILQIESGGGLPEFMTASSFSFDGSACTGYNGDNSADYVIVPKSYSIGGTITTYQAYNNSSTNLLRTYYGDGQIQATFISTDGMVEKTYTSQSNYNSNFATDFPNGAFLKSMTASDPYVFMDWEGYGSITPPIVCNGVTYTNAYSLAEAVAYGSVSLPLNFSRIKTMFIDGSDVNVTNIVNPNSYGNCNFSNSGTLILQAGITALSSYAFSRATFKNIMLPSTITDINYGIFNNATSLENIIIDGRNSVYDNRDNCNAIISTATNTLIQGCKNTTIPNTISTIGSYAFFGQTTMPSIDIPSNITTISNNAFQNCYTLSNIGNPSGVSLISNGAFYNCSSLTAVSFPMCADIGKSAFRSCRSLSDINFPACTSIGDGAFWDCALTTASFPVCKNISGYAFYSCSSLTAASFPACTSIGSQAFQYCSSLTTVNFPVCTSIGSSAFVSCSSLSDIIFPVCASIYNFAFRNCTSLTTIDFPVCSSIGGSAFASCTSLTTVSFPMCTNIGYSAFTDCTSLTIVDFPMCMSIDRYAFYNCTALTSANFPACTSTNGGTFQSCTALTNVSLPKCSIATAYMFAFCTALTSVSLPACTNISELAFRDCTALSALYLNKSATLSSINAFNSTPISKSSYLGYYGSIYVPESLLTWYQSATNWAIYSSRITTFTPTE